MQNELQQQHIVHKSGAVDMPSESVESMILRLQARMKVSEFEFQSSIPIIGGIISTLRRMWANVAARWLLRHYAAQQLEYQTTLLQLLYALHEQNENMRELSAQQSVATEAIATQLAGVQQNVSTRLNQVADGLAAETVRAKMFEHDIQVLSRIVLKPEAPVDSIQN